MPVETTTRPRKLLSPSVGAVVEFVGGEDKGRQVPLVYSKTVLGRKFGDILIRDIKVSGTHAALEYRKDRFFIVDLGSSNGTFLKDEKVRESVLNEGDVVRIGLSAFHLIFDTRLAQELNAKRPVAVSLTEGGLAELIEKEFISERFDSIDDRTQSLTENISSNALLLVALEGPTKGKQFKVEGASSVIGRANSDINLKDPDVSRRHALIERKEGGQIILRDLASRNGTFVNQRKITNCVLNKGDQIKVGQTVLVFNGWVNL